MNKFYSSKNIIITGGSKGIGKAVALELASLGAKVLIVARNKKVLLAAQKEINTACGEGACEIYSCDVSDLNAIKACGKYAVKLFGKIDGLINNAGTSYPAYFEEIPDKEFDSLMKIDYLGSVYFTKYVLSHMNKGSFISFTSSVVGYMGVFGFTAYAAAKYALVGFAESLIQELRPKGIYVSVLCPPDTDTPGFEQENKDKPFETRYLSEGASLMSSEAVAHKFLKKLAKHKFIINVNFSSSLFYRIHGIFPGITLKIMHLLVYFAVKKKNKGNSKGQS